MVSIDANVPSPAQEIPRLREMQRGDEVFERPAAHLGTRRSQNLPLLRLQ
jgi:hypothetical protein